MYMSLCFELHVISVLWQEPDHPDAEEQYVFEDLQVMHDFELHKFCLKYKVRLSWSCSL